MGGDDRLDEELGEQSRPGSWGRFGSGGRPGAGGGLGADGASGHEGQAGGEDGPSGLGLTGDEGRLGRLGGSGFGPPDHRGRFGGEDWAGDQAQTGGRSGSGGPPTGGEAGTPLGGLSSGDEPEAGCVGGPAASDHETRRLHWPGGHNVRDLGGLRTRHGWAVRRGALIRSSSLHSLTPAGIDAFRASGVGRIVDLRYGREAAREPNPFSAEPIYRLVPMIDEELERRRVRGPDETLGDIYVGSVDTNAHMIADVMAAIADAPEGGVLIHCAAGKDRTGMIVALLLATVGVSHDVIAADYAYSDVCLVEYYALELASLPDDDKRAEVQRHQHCPPESILRMLAYVEKSYGSVLGYLRAIGVTDDQVDALRIRLRGSVPPPAHDRDFLASE